LIFALERLGLRLPDLLIAENESYGGYLQNKYDLPQKRFRYVTHGADDRVFFPVQGDLPTDVFRVSYHGTYLPSHGLDVILGAARLLQQHCDVRFEFYGVGPDQQRITALARQYRLLNTRFHGHVPHAELFDGLTRSHVVLGVFGLTRQSLMTVQNKLWEGLAMARAVVSGESSTVREALMDREEIYLIERGKPEALANAILELKSDNDLRDRIARQGHQRFLRANSVAAIGAKTAKILEELVSNHRSGVDSTQARKNAGNKFLHEENRE